MTVLKIMLKNLGFKNFNPKINIAYKKITLQLSGFSFCTFKGDHKLQLVKMNPLGV